MEMSETDDTLSRLWKLYSEILLQKYEVDFENSLLQLVKGYKIKIEVDKEATPNFRRPYPILYILPEKIKQELKKLQEYGIITPVEHAE